MTLDGLTVKELIEICAAMAAFATLVASHAVFRYRMRQVEKKVDEGLGEEAIANNADLQARVRDLERDLERHLDRG